MGLQLTSERCLNLICPYHLRLLTTETTYHLSLLTTETLGFNLLQDLQAKLQDVQERLQNEQKSAVATGREMKKRKREADNKEEQQREDKRQLEDLLAVVVSQVSWCSDQLNCLIFDDNFSEKKRLVTLPHWTQNAWQSNPDLNTYPKPNVSPNTDMYVGYVPFIGWCD